MVVWAFLGVLADSWMKAELMIKGDEEALEEGRKEQRR